MLRCSVLPSKYYAKTSICQQSILVIVMQWGEKGNEMRAEKLAIIIEYVIGDSHTNVIGIIGGKRNYAISILDGSWQPTNWPHICLSLARCAPFHDGSSNCDGKYSSWRRSYVELRQSTGFSSIFLVDVALVVSNNEKLFVPIPKIRQIAHNVHQNDDDDGNDEQELLTKRKSRKIMGNNSACHRRVE